MLLLLFQARIQHIFTVNSQTVHPQALLAGLLQFFPLSNPLWCPFMFHHQYLSLRHVIYQSHLQVSCNIMSPHIVQDSGDNNYLALSQIIFWTHCQVFYHIMSPQKLQDSVIIYTHKHIHHMILYIKNKKQPLIIHMLWPLFSL